MGRFGIVKKDKTEVTAEILKQKFPQKANTITDELIQLINEANNDPHFNGDEFLDNMVTYKSIMLEGSASMKDYTNALKFCAYLEAYGDNVTEAYKKARATDEFVLARLSVSTDSNEYKELTSAASRYRKSTLVKKILTQSDMPLYLMFQGARYEAVGVLSNEMLTAAYSKDRINAAKALLEQVKPPENVQIELDIGIKENNSVEQLNKQLAQIAGKQKFHLESGSAGLDDFGAMKVKDEDIIDAETE